MGEYHMETRNAIKKIPIYADEPLPKPVQIPMRMRYDAKTLTRKYGILVIMAAAFTIYSVLLSAYVHWTTEKATWVEAKAYYDQKLEDYKTEQSQAVQAEHFKSGEASLEAQINQEADLLSKVSIWKTDEAFLTFCCNVWVRVCHDGFPNSVKEVLEQEKQYDFYNPDAPIDTGRQAKAVALLQQLHEGRWPAHLTTEHLYLEMMNDGNICVLHTDYEHRGNDITWRYQG